MNVIRFVLACVSVFGALVLMASAFLPLLQKDGR